MNTSRAQFFVSLKSKKRIESLFKSGGKVFGKHAMLRHSRSGEPGFQVVFAVAAKLGDAHVRNRIKRRLREALFAVLKAGEVKSSGFDVAILPKKEVADLPFTDLCDDLEMMLKRLPKK